MTWFALHTKPRQEGIAQVSLQREGIETFLPKLRRKRTIRRVRRWVISPLFPSYLFAQFDQAQSGRLVRYATGVINIVSFGGKPAVVADDLIAEIRAHCELSADNCLLITVPPPELKVGDRVEIQTGPLRGLQGIFEREMSDQERVVILLDALAKGAKVQVSREQLEKVS